MKKTLTSKRSSSAQFRKYQSRLDDIDASIMKRLKELKEKNRHREKINSDKRIKAKPRQEAFERKL